MFIYFILHLSFESENLYLHLTNLDRRFRRHFFVNYTILVIFPSLCFFYIVMVNLNAEYFVNLSKSVKNTLHHATSTQCRNMKKDSRWKRQRLIAH